MYDEETTSTLTHHVKTRLIWFTLDSNTPKTVSVNIDNFAEWLATWHPQCNFLYGFFQCQLLEDTIDIEITVRTLKGIHTLKKDRSTMYHHCSPWGSQVHPFPSFMKKMEAHLVGKKKYCRPFLSYPYLP